MPSPQKHGRTHTPLSCSKKLRLDINTGAKEAARANNLATNTPLFNGRTDAVQEEKGRTFMDSPGMKPVGKKEPEVDMRKMAILKNAKAAG
ncbi:MAG: hypothetical protein KF812_13795, partial [Fimbriimonadaceae bacterium]|nr:hypothetical protein [Fimbriimonadaceae bacterium]